MKGVERLRMTVTGSIELVEEITPERMRVLVVGARPFDLILEGGEVFLRNGSVWRRLASPPRLPLVTREKCVTPAE